jgi:hypothetical protein
MTVDGRVLPVGQLTAKLTLIGNIFLSDRYRVPKLNAYYRPTPAIEAKIIVPG